ncbi:MAG: imidazole glycerol phosphate synthase subunit HisH [Cyclobacteriaceae bacterium]
MDIVIIKYNAGNVVSVTNALNRLGIEPILSDDPEVIKKADKVIFPGVGEASTAMNYLKKHGLHTLLPELTQPFLGICLGLQLMCRHSEENNTDCLHIFKTDVRKFPAQDKVPHMGWNKIICKPSPLLKGIAEDGYIYFVHSYYAEIGAETLASSNYIVPFSAVLQKDNFYAVQGHPEKSGNTGNTLLQNFINL